MGRNWKVFIFDFDGVLVDSYSCLPILYDHIAQLLRLGNVAKKFIEKALKYEDEQDAMGNYDRKWWWTTLFKEFRLDVHEEKLDELLLIFHKERIEQTRIIKGATDLLELLKNRAIISAIIAGDDGQRNMKKKRIEESGLMKFLKDILIVGEDVKDRKEGVNVIMKKYNALESQIVFIDDKPSPINEIRRSFKHVTTIRVKFEGILKLAWNKKRCIPTSTIETVDEIRRVVDI